MRRQHDTFTVTKAAATALASSVDYTVNPNTAVAYRDYAAGAALCAGGTLNFAAGVTTQTITLSITDDAVYELTENFNVNLSNAVNATISDAQGDGTILDDDSKPAFSINDMTVNGRRHDHLHGDEGGATALASSVDYTVNPNTAGTPGDTTAGTGALSGTLSFSAGVTTQMITLNVTDDAVYELTEDFTVDLSNAVAATISDNQGIGTITDNDAMPSFSINDVTVSEGDGTITFTVTKTGLTDQASSVDYTVNPNTAVTPGDYAAGASALSGTLSFAAGVTMQTITLNITDDSVYELTEDFYVNLSNAVLTTISDAQGIGTILDDDSKLLFRSTT